MQEPDRKCRRKECQDQNETKTNDNGLGVLLFERIKEELVPAINREGRAEVGKKKKKSSGGQKPRSRPRAPAPEAKREAEEPL